MGAVATGAILVAILLVLIAAFVLQSGRRGDAATVYVIGDAARFVHAALEPATRERLDEAAVRRVLEWQIYWQQVVAPREGRARPVVGSGEAMDYVLSRAAETGRALEPHDVAEVMAAEVEYLLESGAIGAPADGEGP